MQVISNNSIRYNISENDGRKNGYGSIVLWGGSFFSNCLIHNNTIYTENSVSGTPSCIRLFNNNFAGIEVFNNIFVKKGEVPLIHAGTAPSVEVIRFRTNNYFSLDNDFKIIWGSTVFNRLEDWRSASQQEMNGAFTTGTSENPLLIHPGEGGTLSDPNSLIGLSSYKVLLGSPIIDSGMDLIDPYSIGIATHDFWGSKIPVGIGVDIGAYEYPVVTGINTPEIIHNTKLTIIPNPLQKEFVILLEGYESKKLQFEMVDMKGIIRHNGVANYGALTKIPFLHSGFYFILLYADNKIIARQRILIQNFN